MLANLQPSLYTHESQCRRKFIEGKKYKMVYHNTNPFEIGLIENVRELEIIKVFEDKDNYKTMLIVKFDDTGYNELIFAFNATKEIIPF